MPSCVVKCCKINSSTQHKTDGITFHRFPIDVFWKCRWVEVIRDSRNEDDWNPSNSSVVCSLHFENSDLYTTKGGLRRVVKDAIPTKELFEPKITINEVPKIGGAEGVVDIDLSRGSLDPLIKTEPEDSCISVISHRELFDEANNEGTIPAGSITSTSISGVWVGPPKVESEPRSNIGISVFHYEDSSEKSQPKKQHAKKRVSKPVKTSSTLQYSATETFREKQLKEKLKEKQAVIDASKKKIKTLHQNIRRLTKRNKLLKHMLKTLKKQTDLYTKLNGIDTDACLDME